jgi:hypothetical protein
LGFGEETGVAALRIRLVVQGRQPVDQRARVRCEGYMGIHADAAVLEEFPARVIFRKALRDSPESSLEPSRCKHNSGSMTRNLDKYL